jgi:hypothetical protein
VGEEGVNINAEFEVTESGLEDPPPQLADSPIKINTSAGIINPARAKRGAANQLSLVICTSPLFHGNPGSAGGEVLFVLTLKTRKRCGRAANSNLGVKWELYPRKAWSLPVAWPY